MDSGANDGKSSLFFSQIVDVDDLTPFSLAHALTCKALADNAARTRESRAWSEQNRDREPTKIGTLGTSLHGVFPDSSFFWKPISGSAQSCRFFFCFSAR